MSVPLTGPESLFVRLGHIFGLFEAVNLNRATTIPPHVDTIDADYQDTNQNLVSSIYGTLLSYQNAGAVLPTSLRTLAQNTLTQMVNDDLPQTSLTSVPVCMDTLIQQMVDASASVQKCEASGSVTYGAENNGNPNIILSFYGSNGLLLENVFRELIRGRVTRDSQSGGATSGRETFQFSGQYPVTDPLSWLYPMGSGCSLAAVCVDGGQSQGRGTQNNLNNSNFESWTVTNIPDAWNIDVGSAGTTVFRSTSVFYDGLASLRFLGNGSQLTSVYQQFAIFSATGDTSAIAQPLTQYAFNMWVAVDAVPSAGEIEVSLTDESGNILLNDQGQENKILIDLTAATTDFVAYGGFFQTPRVMPERTRIRIRLSQALENTKNVYMDRASLAVPYEFYVGGPFVGVFSGNEILIAGDTAEIEIHNDYGGLFQRLFDRFYGMKGMRKLLPSSDTPTIPDSLIL